MSNIFLTPRQIVVLKMRKQGLTQLEIARQLTRRDCVLVQGPPGTGKTLLAQTLAMEVEPLEESTSDTRRRV
jgi:MoxR-like ATPase